MGRSRHSGLLVLGALMSLASDQGRADSPPLVNDLISGVMKLDLSDEQAALLEKELTAIIENDRYFLSPRIQTLREIRNMIRPEPKREPLPEPKHYEPPSKGRYRRRR